MTVLAGDRPQTAWGDDFALQYSHFLLCFRPISALWAVIGRNDPMLADSAARSAGLQTPPARSVDCGSWPGRDSGPLHIRTSA